MTERENFLHLLRKYREGNCTAEEYDAFFSLLLSDRYDDEVRSLISTDYYNGLQHGADLPPHVAQEIARNIVSSDEKVKKLFPVLRKRAELTRWIAAACFLAVLATAAFFYFNKKTGGEFSSIIPQTDIAKKNDSHQPLKTRLPDGSEIVLQPGSRIHYPAVFGDESREVYLEGDAHFEISHNPSKPFLVYCNSIVTKVLGTSFDIQTNKENGDIEVAVRTGRVQVYENEALVKIRTISKPVILTANERVLYSSETQKVTSTLVEKPLPIITEASVMPDSLQVKRVAKQGSLKAPALIYDQSKLETVFDDIRTIYGVEMVVENSNLNNCVFTGDVRNKDLFVLLKIICLSTNSEYEVLGTKVLVKGKGCPR